MFISVMRMHFSHRQTLRKNDLSDVARKLTILA